MFRGGGCERSARQLCSGALQARERGREDRESECGRMKEQEATERDLDADAGAAVSRF